MTHTEFQTILADNPNTIVTDADAHECAIALARGSYQRDLLDGHESLSGSTLRGTARSYSGRYAVSRAALLARIDAAGIPCTEVRGRHGKRVLVIGEVPTSDAVEVAA